MGRAQRRAMQQGRQGGGMPGGMNMNQLMQQAQMMQQQLLEAQEKAKEMEVTTSAGGGMVKVTATGDMKVTEIVIDPEALDPEEVDLLQDMLLAAINDALTSASEAVNQEVQGATGINPGADLGIPGLF